MSHAIICNAFCKNFAHACIYSTPGAISCGTMVTSLARNMSTTEPFCLGCGTALPAGSYRRLLGSAATRHIIPVWREVLDIVLEKKGLAVDHSEESVVTDKLGFICRKCLRGLETFKASKEKLLFSAEAALQHMPTRSQAECNRKRTLDEESSTIPDIVAPRIQPRTAQNPVVGTSPSVQVDMMLVLINLLTLILYYYYY